ncbi:hypothetical protein KR084_005036, partial [Drosophila pseudotakahashii]
VRKNDQRLVEWTPDRIAAYEACKQSVTDAVLLAHPSPTAQLVLVCDASDVAIGAAIEQVIDGHTQPLGFFSKKLMDTEKNYSTYDRELLSIYEAIKYFKHFLEGRILCIKTDHKPLVYAFRQRPEKASPRQLRHLGYISQFTTEIVHVKGAENTVADAFSRLCAINMPVSVTLREIEEAQSVDSELPNLLQGTTSLRLERIRYDDNILLYCDVSTNTVRPNMALSFKALMCHPNTPWPELLPVVLLGLRTCFKEDLNSSAAEMLYGTLVRLPNEFF